VVPSSLVSWKVKRGYSRKVNPHKLKRASSEALLLYKQFITYSASRGRMPMVL
jgi:hypothetical protein